MTLNRHGERIYSPNQNRPSVLPEVKPYVTLHELFAERLDRFAANNAFICGLSGAKKSYADVAVDLQRYTSELYHTFHVRAGATVCILSPNTLVSSATIQACLRLGARVTTMNPMASSEEIRKQLDLSHARVVISVSMLKPLLDGTNALATKDSEKIRVLYTDLPLSPLAETPVPSSDLGYLKGKRDDTVLLPFSSGTTGVPKGVQLTNLNLIANVMQMAQCLELTESDRAMAVLPYFHIYGFTALLHCLLINGASQVVFPKFDMAPYLKALQEHKATMLFVAPPMIVGFVKYPGTAAMDVSSVRMIISGAAPLSEPVQKLCEKIFPNSHVVQGYGLTETSPVTHFSAPGFSGCAGSVVSDTEMRIVEITDKQRNLGGDVNSVGKDVEEGAEGEIWVRGPQVMKGYLRDEDTKLVMTPGGWFRTGDIGRVDAKSEQLIITDRLKELIKYKGYQIAPAELEGVLASHPLVHDAIVIAVPDPGDSSSELARGLVTLKPTATEEEKATAVETLLKHVEAHVAAYKKLRGGLRVVEVIPKSPAGKLLRRVAKASELEYLKTHPRH